MRLFADHDAFHRDFLAGLHRVLDTGELGAFILVLANSLQAQDLRQALGPGLSRLYEQLWPRRMDFDSVADDIRVFERLAASNIEDLPSWTFHDNAPWVQLVNPMRALRPPRNAALKLDSIMRPFDAAAFHFNKPYLASEVFSVLDIHGSDITLMFNKFPYMPYHFLLVPDIAAGMPQYLEQSWHGFIWRLSGEVAAGIAGAGFGYSTIGACASVNHLHFQGFIYPGELPVENPDWTHNGGENDYPVDCERFDDERACWERIENLQAQQQAYNLLFRDGCCYLFRRRIQGSKGIASRLAGAGWCELSGVFNETRQDALTSVDAQQITLELATLRI